MTSQVAVDLNDALGKALLEKFFEPIPIGRDVSTGNVSYTSSGVAMLATEMFRQYSTLIVKNIWEHINLDALAAKTAELVVKTLVETPGRWQTPIHEQTVLRARILEIVAQQLGQRVVDQMDVQLNSRPAIETSDQG